MRTLGSRVAALGVVLALAPTTAASAATGEAELRRQVAGAVVQAIPGARIADEHRVDPLVGMPPLADVVAGRAESMMDPAFWTQIVGNLLTSQTMVLPSPVDVVRPEMYLPTVRVADGGRVWPLPRREVDLDGLTYEWQGRRKTLREYLRSAETDAVAVLHEGRIVDDLYANGWSADVQHQPWSVTKSFVSAIVGIAIDEGKVRSVSDPIDAYIGELRGTAWEGTTIQNLLEMESGVHWDEGTPVLAVNTQVQQWVQAALDLYSGGTLGQGRNAFLKSLPRVAPQGTRFSYNSGNTQVLAWLMETVYGKPFHKVVSEKLWIPIGMASDAKLMTDRAGDAIASQGLYSRIFDLARFGELYRNGGRTPDGRQIVSERWVRESTAMTAHSEGAYGYQWWAGPLARSFEASGFEGQKISVVPSNCLTAVRLGHTLGLSFQDGMAVEMGEREWHTVLRATVQRLGGCEPVAGGGAPVAAAPRLGAVKRLSRRAALRRRALRLPLAAPAGSGPVRLRATARAGRRTVTIATRVVRRPPARLRHVSLRLTRRGVALLRRSRSLRVTVTATQAGRRVGRTVVVR